MSDTRDLASYRNPNLSPFGSNTASETAYWRVERVIVATHLVTNFIPEHEPVRTSIRAKSLGLLVCVLGLREGFRAAGPEKVNEIIADLLELATLFEIANAAGYLSSMNTTMLQKACADTAAYLRHHEDAPTSEGVSFQEDYFVPPVSKQAVPSRERSGNVKDISIRQNNIKDNFRRTVKKTSPGKRIRHDAVLNIVREKKQVSIKDVVQAVPGYSEKTIQRELLALVSAGLVRRVGERRWSTYVLVE